MYRDRVIGTRKPSQIYQEKGQMEGQNAPGDIEKTKTQKTNNAETKTESKGTDWNQKNSKNTGTHHGHR